ncbi:MAG TPA: tetratricopeptide repeat protein [Steroidobacteraceae bacterium]|jgi:tetratricopeptide (TPR) repeat protein|nr:tetratricopeptide repeat protein [Steroidobacteraceae bacterium]
MRSCLGTFIFTATLVVTPVGMCFAHGGGPSGGSGSGMVTSEGAMRNREEAAKIAYNSAIRTVKNAKDYDSDAAKAATPEKSAKAHEKAQKYYHEAVTKLIDVVGLDPKMYQAWNYLGFANRHLGNYEDALSSYDKALELNPTYADATEYRGEAYLGLNRIDDAKGAYMTLFRDSRPLADELMTAMHNWAEARRKDAQGVSPTDVEAFAKWMDERESVAAQTASLATGAPPIWR